MRLTLIISSLSAGGAERVMTMMANYWAAKNWDITILTFDDGTRPAFFELDQRINHQPLDIAAESVNLIQGLRMNLRRVAVLRRAIVAANTECVISFITQTNVLSLLATRPLRVPTIVEEHIDITSHELNGIWRLLRKITYRWAARIVVLTDRTRAGLSSALQRKTAVIPNPVLPARCGDRAVDEPSSRRVLAAGRLVPQKGFDLLIKAFSLCAESNAEWTLTIIGAGPLRGELESLSASFGLSGRVSFTGEVASIGDYFRQADLFVLPSRYEGFPMVLCEAMAHGLPVIATDCPTGPREIIRDGIDGVLVANEDVKSLGAAMDRLMSDDAERQRLAVRAREVFERFGLQRVMAMWEELLADVVK